MPHIVLHLTIDPTEEGRDIVITELADLNFEGFLETEAGVDAYVEPHLLDQLAVYQLLQQLHENGISATYTTSIQEDKNWNEEWESNFAPVEVERLCRIRAPFHPTVDGFEQELIIMPKMSFGTGHHSTTWMMVKLMMEEGVDSPVLDMGCGTSVLAILARKLGAAQITAIDIDEWAFANSPENIEMNNAAPVQVLQGDASLLAGRSFNTIIANINRNVLMADIPAYAECLNSGCSLFLSGFYTQDLPDIQACAELAGFTYIRHIERENWVAARFEKSRN